MTQPEARSLYRVFGITGEIFEDVHGIAEALKSGLINQSIKRIKGVRMTQRLG